MSKQTQMPREKTNAPTIRDVARLASLSILTLRRKIGSSPWSLLLSVRMTPEKVQPS